MKDRETRKKQRSQLLLADVPDVLAASLSACFAKEDWQVCTLGKGAAHAGARRYASDLMTEEAEDVFALEDADVLAAPLDSGDPAAVARLERLLALAKGQQHLQHIFLFGSADVFSGKAPANEQAKPVPETDMGRRHARLETLALSWKREEHLPVTIVRLPELWGEGLTDGDGFFGAFLAAAVDGADGAEAAVRVHSAQEFLSARDAAYGVWHAVERDFSRDFLHLGSGQGYGFDSFTGEVRELLPAGTKLPVAAQGRAAEAALSFGHPFLDCAIAYSDLGWQPRGDLREGIRTSVQSFLDRREAAEKAASAESRRGRLKKLWNRAIPYVENAVGALIMAGVAALQQGSPVNHLIGVDFNYV